MLHTAPKNDDDHVPNLEQCFFDMIGTLGSGLVLPFSASQS